MARETKRSKRKISGGLYSKLYRKKRRYDLAGDPTLTKLGQRKIKKVRARSAITKIRTLTTEIVNVYNPKTKKTQKTKIKAVVENPANRHYVRRNILTKGTIIETELGRAKITSRPGQEGTLNAVLL
jgi:small subunit ribosomal protein S8e